MCFFARKLEFIGSKVFFRWNLRWRRREKLYQHRIVLKNYSAEGGLPDGWQYFGDMWPKFWVLGFLRWTVYQYWFQSWLHHFSNFWYPYIRVWLFYTPHHFSFEIYLHFLLVTCVLYIVCVVTEKESPRIEFGRLYKDICCWGLESWPLGMNHIFMTWSCGSRLGSFCCKQQCKKCISSSYSVHFGCKKSSVS